MCGKTSCQKWYVKTLNQSTQRYYSNAAGSFWMVIMTYLLLTAAKYLLNLTVSLQILPRLFPKSWVYIFSNIQLYSPKGCLLSSSKNLEYIHTLHNKSAYSLQKHVLVVHLSVFWKRKQWTESLVINKELNLAVLHSSAASGIVIVIRMGYLCCRNNHSLNSRLGCFETTY